MASAASGRRSAESDRLRPFLPRRVVHWLADGAEIGGTEPVDGAVLSVDIVGFTNLADRLRERGRAGPELLQGRLDEILAPTVARIERHGGEVLGFAGDSVLAVFEGDGPLAENARTAARSISRAKMPPDLNVRTGIAVGRVTLGLLGDRERAHVVTLGEAVRAGVRAQQESNREAVLVADERAAFDSTQRGGRPEIAAFLPPEVRARVRAGRAALVAEHRSISSVFAALDPHLLDAAAWPDLQHTVRRALAIVRSHGGDLRQIETGSDHPVLVVTFGVPDSHFDDEARAVACATDLGADETVRSVGVSSGAAFCGVLGTSRRRDFVVVGTSVNIAARLMSSPQNDGVLIDDETHTGLISSPESWSPHTADVRGIAAPVTAWSPGPSGAGPRAARPARFVGRDSELTALRAAWQRVQIGTCELLTISGPPGIGKSTLAQALADEVDGQALVTVQFTARSSGWMAWGPAVRQLLGLSPGPIPPTGIEVALAALLPRRADQAGLLEPVLGGESALPSIGRFDAQSRSELVADLLAEIFTAASTRRALLVRVEDCQLAEDSTLHVLRALERAPGRVLVLAVKRSPWPGGHASGPAGPGTHIELGPLSLADSRRLALVLPLPVLDAHIDRLVEYGDGNPLQLEQLAWHLNRDQEHPIPSAANGGEDLPSGLRRVLRARLDRLGESAQSVAKVASVVDDVVSADLLAEVLPALGDRAAIGEELEHLAGQAILVATAAGEYRFRHGELQAVTYLGIGDRSRQNLHGATARYFVRTAAGVNRAHDLFTLELIAWHYARSRDRHAQRQWLARAGPAARAAWSLGSATNWYAGLVPLLAGADRTRAELALADLHYLTGDWPAARSEYDAVLAATPAGRPEQAAACHGLGVLAIRTASTDVAIGWFERAIALWSTLQEPARLVASLDRLTFAHHVAGSAESASISAERLLRAAEDVGDDAARADAYETAALAAWTAGDVTGAAERLVRAIELARHCDNRRCLVHGLSDLAGVRLELGDPQAALTALAEADSVAQRIGYRRARAALRANRGEILRQQGELEAAREEMVAALGLVLDLGDLYVAVSVTGNLGLVEAAAGRTGSAERILRVAVRAAEVVGSEGLRREYAGALDSIDSIESIRPEAFPRDASDPTASALLVRLEQALDSAHRSGQ